MATIRDIAEKLGVSVSTVSKGLNNGPDISEDLRRSILRTAVELGYSKRGTQRGDGRKFYILVENMAYESEEDFGNGILVGFRTLAYRDQTRVTVVPVDHAFQQAHEYSAYALEQGFAGAMILGFSRDDPWMEQFEQTAIPTVLFDNYVRANPHVSSVGTDCDEAMEEAVSHLAALGHEKIAFLNGSKGSLISDQRMAAYLSTMAAHHLPVNPHMAVYGYFVADAARYHVSTLLDLGATAILCGNDLIASGVIEECTRLGYSVPGDVSVIGFDDIPLAARLDPPLTTIRQDTVEIGKCGYCILAAMTEDVSFSRTMLRPELIVRSSTALAKPRLSLRQTDEKDSVLYVNPELYTQHLAQTM